MYHTVGTTHACDSSSKGVVVTVDAIDLTTGNGSGRLGYQPPLGET